MNQTANNNEFICPRCHHKNISEGPPARCPKCNYPEPSIGNPRAAMPEQPNAPHTWEVIHPLTTLGSRNQQVAHGLHRHFHLPENLGLWLVDQAIESLTESPYAKDSGHSVVQEAILIATRMGYITDPEYIQIVHERCVKRANQ